MITLIRTSFLPLMTKKAKKNSHAVSFCESGGNVFFSLKFKLGVADFLRFVKLATKSQGTNDLYRSLD